MGKLAQGRFSDALRHFPDMQDLQVQTSRLILPNRCYATAFQAFSMTS
jgi:hypothetical protein